MTDLFNKLLKIIDHERGKIIGVAIGVAIVLSLYGCSPEIKSPITGETVTRKEFKSEAFDVEDNLDTMYQQILALQSEYNTKVERLNAQIETANEEFKKIETFQKTLLDLGSGAATTLVSGGTVNAGELIASLIAAAGVFGTGGALVDHVRKNKVINKLKEEKAS